MASEPFPFVLHTEKWQRHHINIEDDIDDLQLSAHLDEHEADSYEPKHRRLPIIPELRFEHSYLRSLRNCLDIEFTTPKSNTEQAASSHRPFDDGSEEYEKVEHHHHTSKAWDDSTPVTAVAVAPVSSAIDQVLPTFIVKKIEWKEVIWITTRDQVIMPFLQGMVWGIAGMYLNPFVQSLFRKGPNAKSKTSRTGASEKLRRKMGGFEDREDAQWLRKWARSIGFAGSDK